MLHQATRATPVRVALSRRGFDIPALPAADWLIALSQEDWTMAVFPGLLTQDDQARVFDLVLDGEADGEALSRAAYSAVAEASGRVWWETIRLVGACDSPDGELLGRLTLRGVDPEKMPFARWVAAVYATVAGGRDEKERMKLDAKLSVPPKGFEEETGSDMDAMMALARSMPGARTG